MPGHVPFLNKLLLVFPSSNSSIVIFFVLTQFEAEDFAGHFLYYFVLCTEYIHHAPLTRIFLLGLFFVCNRPFFFFFCFNRAWTDFFVVFFFTIFIFLGSF